MWFSLGGDKDIVGEMAAAAYEVPSYKFLPLAYQLASRLSRAGRNRALDDSGFSVRPTGALGIKKACTRARDAASVARRCIIIGRHATASDDSDGKGINASVNSDALQCNEDLNKVAVNPYTLAEDTSSVKRMAEAQGSDLTICRFMHSLYKLTW